MQDVNVLEHLALERRRVNLVQPKAVSKQGTTFDDLPSQRVAREVLHLMNGGVKSPGSYVRVAPFRPHGDRVCLRIARLKPRAEEVLGHTVRPRGIDVSNPRRVGRVQHLMATPLQFGDITVGTEVALPPKRDVRGSAERCETESQATDSELA